MLVTNSAAFLSGIVAPDETKIEVFLGYSVVLGLRSLGEPGVGLSCEARVYIWDGT